MGGRGFSGPVVVWVGLWLLSAVSRVTCLISGVSHSAPCVFRRVTKRLPPEHEHAKHS